MSTPNILSNISKLNIKPNVAYGSIPSTSAVNLLGGSSASSYLVEDNTVVRIVNLMVSASDQADSVITISLNNSSGIVANLFTDYIVYRGNTVCLLDEASPMILEEGFTLYITSDNTTCNYYIAYEKIFNG